MIDYTLRFPSEAEAMLSLYADGIQRYPNTDVIGTIYRTTGEVIIEADGSEYHPVEPVPGYHVNVRSEEPIEELEPYAITVDTPIRVWA